MLSSVESNRLLREGCKSNIEILVQQRGSKLSRCVANSKQRSKREIYDTLSTVDASVLDLSRDRNKDTEINTAGRKRYVSNLKTYEWADLIYREDKISSLGDPTSVYAINAAYALGRAKDKAIISNALSGVEELRSGNSVTVSLSTSQKIFPKEKGLDIEKLRQARACFNKMDVDPDDEQFIAVSGEEMSDLLSEIQTDKKIPLHESDVIQGLVEGRINKFLGFTFKIISKSLFTTETHSVHGRFRHIPAWSKNAILLSTGKDISVDIQRRPDRRNAVQVYASMECAAIRLDANGAVALFCKI